MCRFGILIMSRLVMIFVRCVCHCVLPLRVAIACCTLEPEQLQGPGEFGCRVAGVPRLMTFMEEEKMGCFNQVYYLPMVPHPLDSLPHARDAGSESTFKVPTVQTDAVEELALVWNMLALQTVVIHLIGYVSTHEKHLHMGLANAGAVHIIFKHMPELADRRRTRRPKIMHLRWEEPCFREVQEPGAAFIRHSWFRVESLLWSMLIKYSDASMQVDRNMSCWYDLCQPNVCFARATRVVFVPTDPARMFWTG